MRDDTLNRHISTKHGSAVSDGQRGKAQQLQSEELLEESKATCTDVKANIKFELMRNNETYKKNIEIGEEISDVLRDGEIVEKSLTKQHKFCLDLFRAWQPTLDVANAELRLWQEQLLDIINEDEMNDRKIIWVKGEKGNEGKSWFQSYVQSLHGAHRVARFDITNKTADLLHIMTRCALATTNIFLFNQQRCISSFDCCYSLLEMIKDGYASSPKFHGTLLRLKTPNVVVVFSNHEPIVRSLSKDRWKILFITKDGLSANHEKRLWGGQKDAKPSSTSHIVQSRLFPRIRNTPLTLGSHLSK